MNHPATLEVRRRRAQHLLQAARKDRIVVVGDVMLDHFIWGSVGRISPEAPVPVVELQSESFMPGGAGNVARNLRSLDTAADLVGIVGGDAMGCELRRLMRQQGIGCEGLVVARGRATSVKTRVVAHRQQVVRVDRENREALDSAMTRRLIARIRSSLEDASAVIICDYGKGVVTQPLVDQVKQLCRERGVWVSLDPKPVHHLGLAGLSLITPNRKEAFELAGLPDETRNPDPARDPRLLQVAERLLAELRPAVLLITLGEWGMLLCLRDRSPVHIPTVAQEVFDVSGAGDTVIACFTMAIAAGASPIEAAVLANHAAGIVVGKVGTATVGAEELLRSFPR